MILTTNLHRGAIMKEAEEIIRVLNDIEGIDCEAVRKGITITLTITLTDEPTNGEILELGILIGQTLVLSQMGE